MEVAETVLAKCPRKTSGSLRVDLPGAPAPAISAVVVVEFERARMATILVVDDEPENHSLVRDILADEGHEVALAENAAQARDYRDHARPDLVLLDVWLPDVDGISLLQEWARREQLTMPVLMLSGHGSIESAVGATQLGAAGYLEKPIALQKLFYAVERSLATMAPTIGSPVASALGGAALAAGTSRASDSTTFLPHGAVPPQAEQRFDLDRPLREAREAFERCYFEFHLAQEDGTITRVAEKTGLERTHLYRKLKQLGLDAWRRQHRQSAASMDMESVRSLPLQRSQRLADPTTPSGIDVMPDRAMDH